MHHLIIVCEDANRNCPHKWPGLKVEERLFWPIEDPAATQGAYRERLYKFRQVRDQIEERIKSWLRENHEHDELDVRRRLGAHR